MSADSFDYLIGNGEHLVRNLETERLGGLEVYDQLDFRGSLDRQIGGLLALENPAGVNAGNTGRVWDTAAVAHQAAGRGERAIREDRRQSVAERQSGELFEPRNEECIFTNHKRAGPQLGQGCEHWIEIAFGAGVQYMELHPEGASRRLQVS